MCNDRARRAGKRVVLSLRAVLGENTVAAVGVVTIQPVVVTPLPLSGGTSLGRCAGSHRHILDFEFAVRPCHRRVTLFRRSERRRLFGKRRSRRTRSAVASCADALATWSCQPESSAALANTGQREEAPPPAENPGAASAVFAFFLADLPARPRLDMALVFSADASMLARDGAGSTEETKGAAQRGGRVSAAASSGSSTSAVRTAALRAWTRPNDW
eukprot:scaffold165142_cov26-Tisochrysis_lutea.AAC.3